MARTVDEIREDITVAYVSNMLAIGHTVDPTTWSATNLQRLFIYVVAFCSFALETIFDLFKADVNATIATLKPHTLRWYQSMALAFQYGFSLLPDSDKFDDTGHTDIEIANSKIISYAAVVEQPSIFGRLYLRMKLAHDNGTDLEPISGTQITSFTAYMNEVKDAGVALIVDSLPPDSIKQEWKIFYDPLLISNTGAYIDGSNNEPVFDAIKNYLKQLPFNGIYVPEYHIDFIQAVKGVVIADLISVETQYGAFPFAPVIVKYTPDAGYLRFDSDSDLVITYEALSPIK
jgi:hypothetical protein